MIVTLQAARTLRCALPYSATNVAKMQALPQRTYDPTSRTWLVPVGDFPLLAAAFPDLQASVEAWEAAYPSGAKGLDRALTFCLNLTALGVSIVERNGRIAAVGDAVSPLLQAEVAAREGPIRVLLAQGWTFRAAERRAAGPDAARWLAGVPDAETQDAGAQAAEGEVQADGAQAAEQDAVPQTADPPLAAVLRGMRSAAARAAEDAERRAARHRGKMRRAAGAGAVRDDAAPRQPALL